MSKNSEDVLNYLNGFFEISDAKVLTPDQVARIRKVVSEHFEKKVVYASYFSQAINNKNQPNEQNQTK